MVEAAYLSQERSCRGSYSHQAGLVHCTGQAWEEQPSNTCMARPSMQLGGGGAREQEGKEEEGREDRERKGEAMEGEGRDWGPEGREVVLPFRVHISPSGRVTVVLRCSCGASDSSVTPSGTC